MAGQSAGFTRRRIHPYFRLEVGMVSGSSSDTKGRRFLSSVGTNDTNGHQWTSPNQTHDIFEGTEQIQQLVISRAISGLRIE